MYRKAIGTFICICCLCLMSCIPTTHLPGSSNNSANERYTSPFQAIPTVNFVASSGQTKTATFDSILLVAQETSEALAQLDNVTITLINTVTPSGTPVYRCSFDGRITSNGWYTAEIDNGIKGQSLFIHLKNQGDGLVEMPLNVDNIDIKCGMTKEISKVFDFSHDNYSNAVSTTINPASYKWMRCR